MNVHKHFKFVFAIINQYDIKTCDFVVWGLIYNYLIDINKGILEFLIQFRSICSHNNVLRHKQS